MVNFLHSSPYKFFQAHRIFNSNHIEILFLDGCRIRHFWKCLTSVFSFWKWFERRRRYSRKHARRGGSRCAEITADTAGSSSREGSASQLCRRAAQGCRWSISDRNDLTPRYSFSGLNTDAAAAVGPRANIGAYLWKTKGTDQKDKFFALVFKEVKIGAINGAVIGAVTALVAWIWYGNPFLGLVIGLGMLVNLILAGLSGASITLIMKKIGIDPAQSSSIILTTVTDVVGFIAFLGFAVLFRKYLV